MSLTDKLNRLISEVRAAKGAAAPKKPVSKSLNIPAKYYAQPIEYYKDLVGKITFKPVVPDMDNGAWLEPRGFKKRDLYFVIGLISYVSFETRELRGAKIDAEGFIDLPPIVMKLLSPELSKYYEALDAWTKLSLAIRAAGDDKKLFSSKIEILIDRFMDAAYVDDGGSMSHVPFRVKVPAKIVKNLVAISEWTEDEGSGSIDFKAVRAYFDYKTGKFKTDIQKEIKSLKASAAKSAVTMFSNAVPRYVAWIEKAKKKSGKSKK